MGTSWGPAFYARIPHMEPTTTEGPPASSSSWKREFLSRTFGVLVLLAFWFVPIWEPPPLGSALLDSQITWPEALRSQWARLAESVDTERDALWKRGRFDAMESFSSRAWTACISTIPLA